MTFGDPDRRPGGSLQMPDVLATPPLQWRDSNREQAICVCGRKIITGCFGWVHKKNLWISLDFCEEARPHVGDDEERPL